MNLDPMQESGGRGVDRTRDPYDVNVGRAPETAENQRFSADDLAVSGTVFAQRSPKSVQRTGGNYALAAVRRELAAWAERQRPEVQAVAGQIDQGLWAAARNHDPQIIRKLTDDVAALGALIGSLPAPIEIVTIRQSSAL